jgi:hypothetical protein
MASQNDNFRSDLAGRAKAAFMRVKEKLFEAAKREQFNSELEKWKKPKPELKPEGNGREAIDRRAFAESLCAESEMALGRAEETVQPAPEASQQTTISDLSGAEMAQALLESYNRSVMAEAEPSIEK